MKGFRKIFVPAVYILLLASCNNSSDNTTTGTTAATNVPSSQGLPPANGVAKKESVSLKISGKIQSFTESIYNTDAAGNKGKLAYSNVFTFNEDGNRTQLQNKRSDGKVNSTTKFTYDSAGFIALEEVFTSEGVLERKFVCKTDAAGRKIEQRDIAKHKARQNKLTYQYEYDAKGNMTRWLAYKGDNSLAWNFVYTYDDKDNRTTMQSKAIDGSASITYKYTYDEKGNMTEEEVLKVDGSLKNKFTYNYKFDKKNNWITQVKMENGKAVEIKERTYKYF